MTGNIFEDTPYRAKRTGIARFLSLVLGALALAVLLLVQFRQSTTPESYEPQCPIQDYYRPSTYQDNLEVLDKIINDEGFKNSSLAKLQRAINIRTEVHDEASKLVEEDPEYWAKFDAFEQFLHETFPLFYSRVELEKVNHHGLLYTWTGSNPTLKPLVLMAHQDTVPVPEASLPQWEHDPFGAEFDGTYLWGRGVADCKDLLVALFESAEELMKNGFEPKRTVIFSFGFDEEVGGLRNKNADRLEEKLGRDSVYAVIDEGGVSLTELEGVTMAIPGTGEKGYIDVEIKLETPGGHSSVPPRHTSIGIMGELIVEIENDEFPTFFTPNNPAYWQYVCMAEHSVDIDKALKEAILTASQNERSNVLVREYIDETLNKGYAIRTTQALDIISGGSKANALPEFVGLTVNSRIAIEESVAIAMDKFVTNTQKFAQKYGLGLVYQLPDMDEVVVLPPTDKGHFSLKVAQSVEVAPLTPTNDTHWDILAGTIRHVYEEVAMPGKYSEPIVVSPGIGSGNTDTKYFWNLTNHIYRYRPGELPGVFTKEHGVNEYIKFSSHLQIIAFYYEYIQSVDEVAD